MERGEVYLVAGDFLPSVRLTGTGRSKYVVSLQSDGDLAHPSSVAVVVASSDRRRGNPLQPYEVSLGIEHGFDHATIVDCRAVYTLPRGIFPADPELVLPHEVMEEIDVALVTGLQMYDTA